MDREVVLSLILDSGAVRLRLLLYCRELHVSRGCRGSSSCIAERYE